MPDSRFVLSLLLVRHTCPDARHPQKISSLLGKDLDVVARSAIKSELELLSGGGDWGGDDAGLNGAGIGEGF